MKAYDYIFTAIENFEIAGTYKKEGNSAHSKIQTMVCMGIDLCGLTKEEAEELLTMSRLNHYSYN